MGLLTSGGDCPGLNAVIRAVVRRVDRLDGEVIGFADAWRGVLEEDYETLTVERCRGLLPRGGTVLGTSRVQPYQFDDGPKRVKEVMFRLGLDGFVVIGGNGSLAAARDLCADGVPCVGVPKTIDNDVWGTDVTFGFDTAVGVATEAIDRLHTTAEAHERVMVVEVMGRDVGHIALHAGLAGGAAMILIPEVPFELDEVVAVVERRRALGRYASIIVVAEGAMPMEGTMELPTYETDEFGHRRLGGIGERVAAEIEARSGAESRTTTLGYVVRGGTPSAGDRVLATRLGVAAANLAAAGAWGRMVALSGTEIVDIELAEVAGRLKRCDVALYDQVAAVFFS
ncbi:MAG: ATP-dependent 6-phosphofructokinase [Microthrixaceae bacterium]